ncbi:substrate-binding periplasmic protein [Pseudodesulfovibrio portus]|uniref:Amino acid ABC transporter substrate-binding protein n=1 Tax=Pseudodesulfovibrio portus TaxID=231439 RepID=A0ABN6RZ49_9BACT|nr:transporter substrate-binding domain-containing protein [Pseudodesulfovibrio portus]BDQ35342.1 amino acid ABC transporter substrate-binding protein [Pseudodesulfovibrio portus]
MVKRGVLVLFCLAAACWPSPGLAERVLFYADDLPPYIQLHKQGVPTGFAVELLWEIVREAGIPEVDVSIEKSNWARAVSSVRTLPGTALLCLARLPERIDVYKWVGPIDSMEVGLFADGAAKIVMDKEEDIFRYRIGVVRNTALQLALLKAYPGIEQNLVELRGIGTQLKMLREGRVDLIAQALQGTRRMMPTHGMRPENYPLVRRLEPLRMYFGFNTSVSDAFIAQLQEALDRLKISKRGEKSRYEQIKAKYFNPTSTK